MQFAVVYFKLQFEICKLQLQFHFGGKGGNKMEYFQHSLSGQIYTVGEFPNEYTTSLNEPTSKNCQKKIKVAIYFLTKVTNQSQRMLKPFGNEDLKTVGVISRLKKVCSQRSVTCLFRNSLQLAWRLVSQSHSSPSAWLPLSCEMVVGSPISTQCWYNVQAARINCICFC